MRTVALYEMLFGLLTIVGGIFGYTETTRLEPLIAGIAGGVLLIAGALKMQKGARTGLFLNLIVTDLLLAYAIIRYIADEVFFPGGVMIVLAGISLLLLLVILVQPKERKRIF